MDELGGEDLVQGEGGGFRAGVLGELGDGHVRGGGGRLESERGLGEGGTEESGLDERSLRVRG